MNFPSGVFAQQPSGIVRPDLPDDPFPFPAPLAFAFGAACGWPLPPDLAAASFFFSPLVFFFMTGICLELLSLSAAKRLVCLAPECIGKGWMR